MADPDLIQLDGFAIGWFARMLGNYELRTCIALAVGQCHLPPRGAPVFVDVGEAAGGGLLPPVLEHPEAQRLLIEGERLLHVPDAEGHMRHPESWHTLSFPCEATLATDSCGHTFPAVGCMSVVPATRTVALPVVHGTTSTTRHP